MEYSNLFNPTTKAKDALKSSSGIYCMMCQETGSMYIGSSVNLGVRLVEPVLNGSSNVHLQYYCLIRPSRLCIYRSRAMRQRAAIVP
jgi:predicted GIY-YIG superfamily endonuclease